MTIFSSASARILICDESERYEQYEEYEEYSRYSCTQFGSNDPKIHEMKTRRHENTTAGTDEETKR
jgi:hypothetical protein